MDELTKEFDRQVENLITKSYPKLAGVTESRFLEKIKPLREKVNEIKISDEKHIPFVIVVKSEVVATEDAIAQIEIKKEKGIVNMTPNEPKVYKTIPAVEIPESSVYLLVNIDTGQKSLNTTPDEGLKLLEKENRSPLTIDEGIAIITHFPEVLVDKKNYNCFYMLASRANDKTVPAVWISYKKPRLGWCWAGNVHTWLGSASCEKRVS